MTYDRQNLDVGTKTRAWVQPLALGVAVVLVWCIYFRRTSWDALGALSLTHGDAALVLGTAKAYMDGDIWPVLQKFVAHLGAPFSANWNDWPVTEDFLIAGIGWTGRLVGLTQAGNLFVLLAHVLAAVSFWFVAKKMKVSSAFALMGGLLYGLSVYAFARGLSHIVLAMYWHVPLLLMLTWWTYTPCLIRDDMRKTVAACVVAFIAGTLNPYYSWMAVQLFGFALVLHVVRKQYASCWVPVLLIACIGAGFFCSNIDTLSYVWGHGKNPGAIARDLADLQLYGLRIPDLFYPFQGNNLHFWQRIATRLYVSKVGSQGEMWSTYLGLVSAVGLLGLICSGAYWVFLGDRPSAMWWQAIWIFAYSVVGGVNLLLGSLGLTLFRATNRFSIFLLTLGLLFLCQWASRRLDPRAAWVVAAAIAVFGLWDQLPHRPSAEEVTNEVAALQVDREFAARLQAGIPPNGMVFQLPVAEFPEMPPIVAMNDYEHFRPYIFTSGVRYSYGTTKGRFDASWQASTAGKPVAQMVDDLQAYGFDAVLINRRGYLDRGEALIGELRQRGLNVVSDSPDLVAFRLAPSNAGKRPEIVGFARNWLTAEGPNRWAIGRNATVVLGRGDAHDKPRHVSFDLTVLREQKVDVLWNGTLVDSFRMTPGEPKRFNRVLTMTQAFNTLELRSDTEPALPGNGDPRMLSFKLSEFSTN
ncbi:MAG: hypothetical protein QM803_03110 [Rhodocyclaceae bacterium]